MPEILRLVSYNILEGLRPFEQKANKPPQFDERRRDAALDLVNELAPDILVLNEALYCRDYLGHRVDYASLFAFPHQAAALYDGAWGNAILSRRPILSWHEMRTHERGGLRANIAALDGELTVATYHPHPSRDPASKAADFIRLIEGINSPLILCGDFNSISPEDLIDKEAKIAAFRRFSAMPEATLDQFIESGRAVFSALGKLGLKDAVPMAGRRYTIPTDFLSLDKSSAIRIDHILANEGIEAVSGE